MSEQANPIETMRSFFVDSDDDNGRLYYENAEGVRGFTLQVTWKKKETVELDLYYDFYDDILYGVPKDRVRREWFDNKDFFPIALSKMLKITQVRLMVVPYPIYADEA